MDKKSITSALNAFLKSPDFESGVIKSTRAAREGKSYKVELFEDGTWEVFWSGHLGNKYESQGEILSLPALDTGELSEWLSAGAGDEDAFLSAQFDLERAEIEEHLQEAVRGA